MKAVLLTQPEHIELVEMPEEDPGPGEVKLRIEACSVCGSDLEGYHGQHPKMTFPRVMGHEVASVVAVFPLRWCWRRRASRDREVSQSAGRARPRAQIAGSKSDHSICHRSTDTFCKDSASVSASSLR